MIKTWILDLLYPPVCMLCGKVLLKNTGICRRCLEHLPWVEGPRCMRCGKPLVAQDEEYCEECKQGRAFDGGIGMFPYRSSMRKAVLDLKNHGKQGNAFVLGACMAAGLRPLLAFWRPDCMVPIPLDRKKLKKRGFNQAKLLSDALQEQLQLSVRTDILYRHYGKEEQKRLHRFARKRNPFGRFYVNTQNLPETILLVDDIYTTGNTLEAAAAVLKAAGVKRVYFVTVCMGMDI